MVKTLSLILTTGRTLKQGAAMEEGKTTSKYKQETAYVELDSEDMDILGINSGVPVKVITKHGEVVVLSKKTTNPQKGIAFIPLGPWANQVVDPTTDGFSMPTYKSIEATIEPAPKGKVLDALVLLRKSTK